MKRRFSKEEEKKRLRALKIKSCAWGGGGERCQGCVEKEIWNERVGRMSCADWEEYRDCQMSNTRAIAFLEHIKTCTFCLSRRYRLMRRREIWWELERRNLQPLVEKLASRLKTRKTFGKFFPN